MFPPCYDPRRLISARFRLAEGASVTRGTAYDLWWSARRQGAEITGRAAS